MSSDPTKESPANGAGIFVAIFAGAILSAAAANGGATIAGHPGRWPLGNLFKMVGGFLLGSVLALVGGLYFAYRKGHSAGTFVALVGAPVLVFLTFALTIYVKETRWRNHSQKIDAARTQAAKGQAGLEELARNIIEWRNTDEEWVVFNESMNSKILLTEATSHALFRCQKERGFPLTSFIRSQPLTPEMMRQVAQLSPPNMTAQLCLLDRKDLPPELIEALTTSGLEQVAETAKRRLAEA